jgi:hypothetical protein
MSGGVQNTVAGGVLVYSPDADSVATPIRMLVGDSTKLDRPGDVGFDSHGLMYVANYVGRITVYRGEARGNTAPLRTIEGPRTGLGNAVKLAVGAGDTLFVLNAAWWIPKMYGYPPVTVTVYAPGATGDVAPVRTLTVRNGEGKQSGMGTADGIAVDRKGVLYVAMWGAIAVYAPGAAGDIAPTRLMRISDEYRDWGRSLMLDGKGRLYVSSEPVIAGF